MARLFITGSADGLGQLAAKQLVLEGHEVVLHARNKSRGKEALRNVPGAKTILTADLSSIEETKQLAADVNALGKFDAVIHNAGVYRASGELIVAVNTLAPYILTSLITKPKRLIYLSSGMHSGGHAKLEQLNDHNFNAINYSDSKFQIVMLALATARFWPGVYSNAVDPGWVPTKMGGVGAPDNLEKGYQTQIWLATSDDIEAKVSGHYFFHQQSKPFASAAGEVKIQNEFLSLCERITNVHFPMADVGL